MKRFEFEALLERIEDKISYYFYENIKERSYWLTLANGEKIRIEFPEFCIPHLLGVDTTYLSSCGLFKEKSSIELLKIMCENRYRIYNEVIEGRLNLDNLFSKYIDKKIDSFNENLKIVIYNINFVCKYDKSKAYLEGKNGYDYDYLICKTNERGEVLLTGYVKSSNGSYVPRTNQYFKNMEEAEEKFSDLLKNQTLTFISNVNIENFNSFALNASQKYLKVIELEKISSNFGGAVDVTGDYKFSLNKYRSSISNGNLMTSGYESIISDCMRNGKIITPDDFNANNFDFMNASLVKIIMSYNDLVTATDFIGNDSNSQTYSKALEELEQLKKECIIYVEKIAMLEKENSELTNKVSNLENSNEKYLKTFEEIDSSMKRLREFK